MFRQAKALDAKTGRCSTSCCRASWAGAAPTEVSLELSRIDIESAGSDPLKLARALLVQLPGLTGPVPIEAIARALDIVSIEVGRSSGSRGVCKATR